MLILKRALAAAMAAMLALSAAACAATPVEGNAAPATSPAAAVSTEDIDFAASPFKHITNGGVTEHETLPYNIDAITGATQTVEGPGVQTSIPLSIREIENRTEGLARGAYTDSRGTFLYEGVDLYYMLTGMVEGDNGIILTENAYSVELKSHDRMTVATLTIDDITRAHEAGRPVLIAYGIGSLDGEQAAPFVFDAANEDGHSLGFVEELNNEDGCLKLVYDISDYGEGNEYETFSNVAYLYIKEHSEPGFKHTAEADSVYASSKYADYLVTLRGSALSREFVLPVSALEALVAYDENGNVVADGVGYSNDYSLANNAYWYVNRYEGLDLYKLLQYLGMQSAEDMGLAASRTTMVNFIAADGVPSTETFSVETLSYPDVFGFYTKNSADPGDGTYIPTAEDLVASGYPVLLAFGVNNYPYTISKSDEGYLSGLSNSGGPLRVVFGKTQYNHANGSRQVQYLSEIIVGEDVLSNTHSRSENAALRALGSSELAVTVTGPEGQTLTDRAFTVAEIENIIYGPVAENEKKAAKVKDSYEVKNGEYENGVYEGVSLEYFLMQTLGLQGTLGTVTFTGTGGELTLDLAAAFAPGFNTELGRGGLLPLIAFAKNGSPLVENEASAGYEASVPLYPYLESEPEEYRVDNAGGPLMLVLPSSDEAACNAASVGGLLSISVSLEPDAYAHISAPYDEYAGGSVRIYGEGLSAERTYAVSELETRQTEAQTLDYSVLNNAGELSERRYRGVSVYDLFTEIGINSNAGDVVFHSADGESVTLPLSLVKGTKYQNSASPDKPALFTMLAYGAGSLSADEKLGAPLVESGESDGYMEEFENAGGPLRLAVPQRGAEDINAPLCLGNIVAIEVTANDVDTWSHAMSDIYSEFLEHEFTLTLRNDDSEWSRAFTLAELESLKQVIVRDIYTVLDIGECEGLDLWKFAKLVAGDSVDLSVPVSVTVYASDGYKNDLLSVFYKEGLELGVLDAEGNRKPILLCYAVNGYPLVDSEDHEGYTGLAGNAAGPLRCVAETVQGASVKYLDKLVITLPGSGETSVQISEGLFAE